MCDNRKKKRCTRSTDCDIEKTEKTATAETQASLPNFICQGLNKLHFNSTKKLNINMELYIMQLPGNIH